jgi:CheY-like chemotaxis protein
MGGDIGFESTLGKGSRFWFDVSLPTLDAAPPTPVPQRLATGYRGSRKKVLIVDDVAQNRALVAGFLKMLDFSVSEAQDGRAAMVLADTAPPDLILMDSVMPVVNGLEATRLLRRHKALCTVPIITISANASQADRDRSLAMGVDAFLPKPIDFEQLLAHIETLLGLSWVYPDAAEGAAPPGNQRSRREQTGF